MVFIGDVTSDVLIPQVGSGRSGNGPLGRVHSGSGIAIYNAYQG